MLPVYASGGTTGRCIFVNLKVEKEKENDETR